MLKIINSPEHNEIDPNGGDPLDSGARAEGAPSSRLPHDEVIIEGLTLKAFIGMFDHEYERAQEVIFDIRVKLAPLSPETVYEVGTIVRYDYIVADITTLIAQGHIDLVETLAEDVAAVCLSYAQAIEVSVKVMKPEAFENAAGVGVRITRRK